MDPKDIKRAVVVGAGTMGHAIAQVFAQAGITVGLVDVSEERLKRALHLVSSNLKVLADHGLMPPEEIPAVLERIHPHTDLGQASQGAQFALEAVSEIPSVKEEVFSALDESCSGETILASNTSSLDIFSIAHVRHPERLVVAHWFAPPHIIPLVEVVPGPLTSPEVVEWTSALMKHMGKRPITMRQFVPSFIVNRIQHAIGKEVMEMLANGWATPEEIDLAVKTTLGVRLPIVGVVQTMDFTGLKLVYEIQKASGTVVPLIEEKVKARHLGASTSQGFYDYQGRPEEEILRKRDDRYLKMLQHLERIRAFEPV